MFKFDNVGQKIKKVARTIAMIVFVLFLISAAVMLINGIDLMDSYRTEEAGLTMIISAVVTGALGYGIAWLSAITLYGFGELIEKTTDTNERIANMEKNVYLIASKDDNADNDAN